MLIKTQVKYIQSLSHKKLRDEEGVFIAEGPKIINELLEAPGMRVRQLFALASWIAENSHRPGSAQWITVSEKELERLSRLTTPNQVLGVFSQPAFEGEWVLEGKRTLLLDTIQDPGNMGTLIRCADWFGVEQLICSEDSADAFNPKVVQSSMGSIARVRVIYTDLGPVIRGATVPVYAAVLDGPSYHELPPPAEFALLIGNESKGISPRLLLPGINRLTIPRPGHAESLNAAVATGILLAHFAKQSG